MHGDNAFHALRDRLALVGVDSPVAEAWRILEHVTGRSRLELLTEPDAALPPGATASIDAILAARSSGVPLQHLLGTAPFWGMTLTSSPAALVPRPETEGLVALGLEAMRGLAAPVVLDLGTGSGAIAAAIASERSDAEVWASEKSAEAATLAEENLARFAPGVRLVQADLLERAELQDLLPRLDLLIANLPYLPDADVDTLPPEVRRDPPEALFGGEDGLAVFRRAWRQAATCLPRHAVALFELDPRNVQEAARWLAACPSARWRSVTVHEDLTGTARFLRVGAATDDEPATP